jgi:hypothetical protein
MTFEEGGIDAPPREIVKGSSRLYQFEQVQPEGGFDDPGCPGTPAETMTCLFPAGTEVNFELGDKNLVSIGRVSDAYRVDFTATVTVL